MKRKLNLLIAAGYALLALPLPAALADTHAHWSYAGTTGPTHWAELDGSFQECKLGTHQSPINIETRSVKKAALKPIIFSYKAQTAEVLNNGHTIQVNLPPGSTATIDGVAYKLVQFHFHTPSEEQIDGRNYPMVAHLVHTDAAGKLAVIAVLLTQGKENPALKTVFDNLPAQEGETKTLPAPINVADMLPADHTRYTYLGSLTTPPCSQDVRWQVLATPVEISEAQLAAFRKLYKMNARPVQPLHGRQVQISSDMGQAAQPDKASSK